VIVIQYSHAIQKAIVEGKDKKGGFNHFSRIERNSRCVVTYTTVTFTDWLGTYL
jgi:hypothetical protein